MLSGKLCRISTRNHQGSFKNLSEDYGWPAGRLRKAERDQKSEEKRKRNAEQQKKNAEAERMRQDLEAKAESSDSSDVDSTGHEMEYLLDSLGPQGPIIDAFDLE